MPRDGAHLLTTTALIAVDSVKWARSQMAFTLGFHIILVPLGVSWAFMTLVANYRAIKYDDADALQLAQRWSKYMAVTFAVGAVTGTVLSFEFGLLWSSFMGRFGAAYGIPFAIEGLFFFTEAIFVAIYIYGWRRLGPWAHFWTGVPIVVAGIGGALSVIAANAWMNEPQGFTLDRAGKIVAVRPWSVIFNRAFPYEGAHMLVAAYVVGGFLIASVYAMGMLRGRRDRYHRLGFIIPFTVAAVMTPLQLVVGDSLTHFVYAHEPAKFAAIELVPQTNRDVPETILGWFDADGRVHGGVRIPGVASVLSDPGRGTSTIVKGRVANPALGVRGRAAVTPLSNGPTIAQANVVHFAWDTMVGLGTLLALLSIWYGLSWWRRRDYPKTKWFLRIAACTGVASVVAMEAGWVVTEVGRQPWIVHNYMTVTSAATTNSSVWLTFVTIVGIYVGLGVTTILVLRTMSRRWRESGEVPDSGVPYGPNDPGPLLGDTPREVPVR